MAITINAAITDLGRAAFADLTVNGTSFAVNEFEVGNGGHDPSNPITALTPDISLTELPGLTFGPEPIDETSLDDLFTPTFLCVLAQNEAVGELSNIGLFATYTATSESFLFAIGNSPLRVKVDSEAVEFLVSVLF